MSRKVISFCLWGDIPKYTIGAIENVKLAKVLFPEWECVFYLDEETVPKEIIVALTNEGAILEKRKLGGWHSMFWRFEPAGNPDIDVLLVRDTDSRLSPREKSGVEEWLASDKDFYIIRDHPSHDTYILGGLWGARNQILKDINKLIAQWTVLSEYQNDQLFLRRVVWPLVASNAFIHDTCWQRIRALPIARKNLEFIGEVYTEFNTPAVQRHRALLQRYIQRCGELGR